MKHKKYQEKVFCDGNGNILTIYPNMCGCHPSEFVVEFPYRRKGSVTIVFSSYKEGMSYYNKNYTYLGYLK